MKTGIQILSMLLSSVIIGTGCRSIAEPSFKVVLKDKPFEVRDYEAYVVAEVTVDDTMENAGNAAFRPLFRYISGNNSARLKIPMTAPVSQEKVSEKISMTAPVSQEKSDKGWTVSFVMPRGRTIENLPEPNNRAVILREVDSRRMAAVRYSGSWSEEKYNINMSKLKEWITERNFSVTGKPVWARYNPPFTMPAFRRNEILIPIRKAVDR